MTQMAWRIVLFGIIIIILKVQTMLENLGSMDTDRIK